MDPFLSIVREVASEYYHVYGELGREGEEDFWYLGRDLSSQKLVALRLRRTGVGADGDPDYDLEVAEQLDASVGGGFGDCRSCGKSLRRWVRFCTHCGADVAAGGQVPSSDDSAAALFEQVRAAAQGAYEVLGEMPWGDGGGQVYFAIELDTRRLVRLRLRSDDTGGGELAETALAMPLPKRLSAAYVTGRLPPESLDRLPTRGQPEIRSALATGPISIGGRPVDPMTLVKVLVGIVVILIILQVVQLAR
ncbi:MAG: hypothetical protein SFV24_08325 [Gemmatimonadales bacterium]|nr:hypothetical protein [Gemmatimonadales bacterium]